MFTSSQLRLRTYIAYSYHKDMEVVVIVVVFLCVALIFFSKLLLLRKRFRRLQLRLPPGPPRWPLVGNLPQLGPRPHRDLARFCSIYGPIVYLRLGNVDAITTDDPDVIREILLRQDDAFASRPRTSAAVHLAYGCGDVALAPVGPGWKRMRRICMEHLLTTRRLDSFAAQRAQEAQHLVGLVWARAQAREPINLREVLGAFSMNNVTRMLLGKQCFGSESSGPSEATEFMRMTHELFRLLGVIYLGDYLPFWRRFDPTGCERKMREVGEKVDEFHQKIIEERKKGEKDMGGYCKEEMDFVDVLLSLPGENGKDHMEDVEIKALMQDMIAAATDTSAVTNEWAMAQVIRSPQILRKVQEELDTVVGRDRMVAESDLAHLSYLRCVVRETFRMHPAGPFLIPTNRSSRLS
uniref:Cytochrome P450 703A2 n=1 Tax=Ananas comosus var. bracteatus TaxID=296719 RepID=A0A6V7NXZ7_ANACO|nr:unnamed protein product [Ananas comosus var. bracteatus]